MSEHVPGTFDRERKVEGKKVVIAFFVGTLLFMAISLTTVYFGGKYWGSALTKKALARERLVEMERVKLQEKGPR